MATVRTELKGHDARISSLHGRVGEIQVNQGNQQIEIRVMAKEVEEARKDIDEAKKGLEKRINELQTNFDKKFETLTAAVKWGTMAMIALIGILIPLVLN